MVTISAIQITLDSCFSVLKGYVKLVRDQKKLYGALVMKQNLMYGLFLPLLLALVRYLAAQMTAVCKERAAKLKQDWILQRQCKSIDGTIGPSPFLSVVSRHCGGMERCSPEGSPTSTIPFVGMHEVAILTQATEAPREIGTALAATSIEVFTFIYIYKEKGLKPSAERKASTDQLQILFSGRNVTVLLRSNIT